MREVELFRNGVGVMYDEAKLCNAISFARGSGIDLDYQGYTLFSHPAREVRAWALARDPNLEMKDGFISMLLGLTMSCDWIDDPSLTLEERQEPAAAFIVFDRAYYAGSRRG